MAAAVTGRKEPRVPSWTDRGPAVIGGVIRALTTTARSAVTDLVATLSFAGESVVDRLTGHRREHGSLRVAVVILSDENGPLITEDQVRPAIDRADAIFREHAGLRVRLLSVRTIAEPATDAALNPRANQRLLLDDIRGFTEPYRRYLPIGRGMGAPVTIVVVREIAGRTTGCSLGMTADWVICQRSLFDAGNPHGYDETVVAHEIGHALNLPHHRDRTNLMYPVSSPPGEIRGTSLRWWQRLVLAGNRHALPGTRTPGHNDDGPDT